MAKYVNLTQKYEKSKINEAAEYIKNGKLVLFPTETVYGIGANGLDSEAVKKIFIAKGRAQDNPLILHISNFKMIDSIAEKISSLERKIIQKFFPGPLTIILERKNIVPDIVTASLDTVAIRMPANKIAHDLIEYSGVPIAAPSANISGKPSGTNVDDIFDELNDKLDYILDGGETKIGLESTVIRVIDNVIHILRPGKITKKELSHFGKVIIDEHVLGNIKKDEKVLSPGMKYKHYAPNTKCILVYSQNKKELINSMKKLENENKNSIVITNNKNTIFFKNSIGYGKNLKEISHNIFKTLRNVDKLNLNLIIIEGVKAEGLGLAIMNRLIRSCSHNYIEI